MKNIVSNSIFFIFISFVILFVIIFFNTSSSNNFFEIVNYILYENKGLFVCFSQFIFINLNKKLSNRELIFNTILCWLAYLLLNSLFTDLNLYSINESVTNELYINREIIDNSFSLMNLSIVKNLLIEVESWDLVDNIVASSFVLLLINSSVLSYFNDIGKNNFVLNSVVFLFLFIFLLYFWNSSLNIFIFLISIMLLKIRTYSA